MSWQLVGADVFVAGKWLGRRHTVAYPLQIGTWVLLHYRTLILTMQEWQSQEPALARGYARDTQRISSIPIGEPAAGGIHHGI